MCVVVILGWGVFCMIGWSVSIGWCCLGFVVGCWCCVGWRFVGFWDDWVVGSCVVCGFVVVFSGG